MGAKEKLYGVSSSVSGSIAALFSANLRRNQAFRHLCSAFHLLGQPLRLVHGECEISRGLPLLHDLGVNCAPALPQILSRFSGLLPDTRSKCPAGLCGLSFWPCSRHPAISWDPKRNRYTTARSGLCREISVGFAASGRSFSTFLYQRPRGENVCQLDRNGYTQARWDFCRP